MSAEKFQFFNSCTPLIGSDDGVQKITVKQTLDGQQLTSGTSTILIQVNGPQFALTETDITGVYPAPGSKDSPDEFLPHIALARRTLPWERRGPGGDRPWLALLLVKDSELNAGGDLLVAKGAYQVSAMNALPVLPLAGGAIQAASNLQYRSIVRRGPSQVTDTIASVQARDPLGYGSLVAKIPAATKVDLLYLTNANLKAIRPEKADLPFLCNVKRTNKGDGDVDCAIVISNRLPDAGADGQDAEAHTAFLVSLEGRDDFYAASRNSKPHGEIGLVVLHSWSFTPSKGGDFEEVVRAVHVRPNGGVLRFGNLPENVAAGQTAPLSGGFAALLDKDGLFLDGVPDTVAGDGTYRSPLRPLPTGARSPGFAVRAAPEEFADAAPDEMEDYSHAAAFELGRLLALASHDTLEDLRLVHGIIKPIEPDVLVNQLPVALQKPEWVVDPAFAVDEPWSFVIDGALKSISKNPAELIGKTPGDVAGLDQQFEDIGAGVLAELGAMQAPIAAPVSAFDINSVTAEALGKAFANVNAKAQH